MKNGRKLTLAEKKLLTDQGLKHKDFLRTKKTAEFYEFVQRSTGKLVTIRR